MARPDTHATAPASAHATARAPHRRVGLRSRPPRRLVPLAAVSAALVAASGCAVQPDADMVADRGLWTLTETVSPGPADPATGTAFSDAVAAGEARLTFLYVPSSGFAYHDDDGRLTGVTVELLRDFARFAARAHGLHLRVDWLEEERWADFYGYVRDSEGGVFGIGNVTITEPRRHELAFSPPYLNNIAVLVTHRRVPELGSMAGIASAFRGLTALPYPGTLHETRLEAIRDRWLPDVPARPVASNDELVSLLASDGEYFGYIDVYNYWRAREAGLPLRRHPVGDDASETFGVIMPHGSDWAPVIEAFFRADGGYTASERFRGLLRHHLGEELARLL
jgi:ABC-type amino acid transport substrate-binding protein